MHDINLLVNADGQIETKQFKVTSPVAVTAYGLKNGDLLYIYRQASTGDFFQWNTGSSIHLSAVDMTKVIDLPGIYKVMGHSFSKVTIDYCSIQKGELAMSLYGVYICDICKEKYIEEHNDGVYVPSSSSCPVCVTNQAILSSKKLPDKIYQNVIPLFKSTE